MTEPTKEQIEEWRIEAQVFIENEKQIHAPLDLYMVTLAYLAAKKSDFEETESLKAKIETQNRIINSLNDEKKKMAKNLRIEIETLKDELKDAVKNNDKVKRDYWIDKEINEQLEQEIESLKLHLRKQSISKNNDLGKNFEYYDLVLSKKDQEIKTLKEQLAEAVKLAKLGIYSVDGLLTHNHESWELSAESWLFKTKIFLEKQNKENKDEK